jgi:hypothetical protein
MSNYGVIAIESKMKGHRPVIAGDNSLDGAAPDELPANGGGLCGARPAIRAKDLLRRPRVHRKKLLRRTASKKSEQAPPWAIQLVRATNLKITRVLDIDGCRGRQYGDFP